MSLLQVDQHPDNADGEEEKERARKELEFAKLALTPNVLNKLPGKSYIRETSIMNDHSALSGKMKTLDYLLKRYEMHGDRVLIFSYSVSDCLSI